MKTLYTDASFDYHSTDATDEKIVRGKIAIADGLTFKRVENVIVGKVPALKQYINILELTAIARAVEIASEGEDREQLAIYSDSQVAIAWASSGKVNPKVSTEAHKNALEYLKKAKLEFGGVITFNFVPRDKNPAGWLLERQLEIESPHAI